MLGILSNILSRTGPYWLYNRVARLNFWWGRVWCAILNHSLIEGEPEGYPLDNPPRGYACRRCHWWSAWERKEPDDGGA